MTERLSLPLSKVGGDVSTKGQRITILGSAGYHVHPNTTLPTAHGPYVTTGWGHVPF